MADRIQIDGLREFQSALRTMNTELPKRIRLIGNEAAGLIVDYTRGHMPSRSGRGRASVKVRSTQRTAGVAVGGSRAPYVPWLDFGGEGRRKGRPAARPFLSEGRYVYQGLRVHRDDITKIMSDGLTALARDAGMEVS